MRRSRRDGIVRQALDIARTHGIASVTYESVATSLGITKAGIVYHFPQRADLLAAMVEQATGEVEHEVERRHDETGRPRMLIYTELLLSGTLHPDSPALVAEVLAEPNLAEIWRSKLDRWTEELVALGADQGTVLLARVGAIAATWMLDDVQIAATSDAITRLLSPSRNGGKT